MVKGCDFKETIQTQLTEDPLTNIYIMVPLKEK